eukprot:5532090-Lingulodinium_polyedra.AAC.1
MRGPAGVLRGERLSRAGHRRSQPSPGTSGTTLWPKRGAATFWQNRRNARRVLVGALAVLP